MQIAILGCGMWACALAALFHKSGHQVCIWGRNPDRVQQLRCNKRHAQLECALPEGIEFTSELKGPLLDSELVIESVTLGGLRDVLGALRRHRFDAPLILTSKGIELRSHLLPSQIVTEIFGSALSFPLLALSGPTLAREVLAELPTCAVLACKDLNLAIDLAKALSSENFSVFSHSDLMGVQFGGAYKNIIAIACGMLDGSGMGANTKAALLTRGLHEMRRLALAIGCLPQTITGLSGVGDLVATSLSTHSRNYQMGKRLIDGQSARQAKERVGSSVEGIDTCRAILELAEKKGIELPIARQVYRCLSGEGSVHTVIAGFMRHISEPEWL